MKNNQFVLNAESFICVIFFTMLHFTLFGKQFLQNYYFIYKNRRQDNKHYNFILIRKKNLGNISKHKDNTIEPTAYYSLLQYISFYLVFLLINSIVVALQSAIFQ